jgi:hypothetical protein
MAQIRCTGCNLLLPNIIIKRIIAPQIPLCLPFLKEEPEGILLDFKPNKIYERADLLTKNESGFFLYQNAF